MPRRARLAIANVAWHIIQRGNNRSVCFFSEQDYLYYLHQLAQLSIEHGCAVHAYCLMTNHIHILLTPEEATGPSLMMKRLGQRYAQYINRNYQRSGTLWEGRFKSCLAQNERYALHCYRYIELNPVRASMTKYPGDYRWSSYSCNGEGVENALITPHGNYLSLGSNALERQSTYRSLVASGVSDELARSIRAATNGNFVLGDACFNHEMEIALNRRVLRGYPGRPGGVKK